MQESTQHQIPSCNCSTLKSCKINSIEQFEDLKKHFEAKGNTYRCIYSESNKKIYRCLKCKREWLFKYPDFPAQGDLYLKKAHIVIDKPMKEYLFRYNPWEWRNEVKYSHRVSVGNNYIRQDESITYVIVRLVGRDSYDAWIDRPIDKLNGYTPRELAANFNGRIVLKSYLVDMSRSLEMGG